MTGIVRILAEEIVTVSDVIIRGVVMSSGCN